MPFQCSPSRQKLPGGRVGDLDDQAAVRCEQFTGGAQVGCGDRGDVRGRETSSPREQLPGRVAVAKGRRRPRGPGCWSMAADAARGRIIEPGDAQAAFAGACGATGRRRSRRRARCRLHRSLRRPASRRQMIAQDETAVGFFETARRRRGRGRTNIRRDNRCAARRREGHGCRRIRRQFAHSTRWKIFSAWCGRGDRSRRTALGSRRTAAGRADPALIAACSLSSLERDAMAHDQLLHFARGEFADSDSRRGACGACAEEESERGGRP